MSKKNLVFIFTDEQSANTMSCYGNNKIYTPNMNALANDSIVFEHAYVTQPVCTPSRSTLLTGLYPHTNNCTENNIPLDKSTKCFPEIGDFSNYKCAYLGKWHLGDEIFAQHGFDEFKSIDDGYSKYYSKGRDEKQISTYTQYLIENGFEPDCINGTGNKVFTRDYSAKVPEEFSKPMYLADVFEDFIENNKDNPFITYINFFEPHMPYTSQRDNQYDVNEMFLPKSYYKDIDNMNNRKLDMYQKAYYADGHGNFELKTQENWKRVIANYWGMVSLVDTALGRVLECLKENNLMDDTIIVYTSDHGDMMGSHKVLAKCLMYEQAVKVPLLIKMPNVTPRIIVEPVSQIDIVPSLLDAMDQAIPEYLQGQSLLPNIVDSEEINRNVFIEWNGLNNGFGDVCGDVSVMDCWKDDYSQEMVKEIMGDSKRTIITSDMFKYTHSFIGDCELYNLNEDKDELNNLYGKVEYNHLINELKNELREWMIVNEDVVELK